MEPEKNNFMMLVKNSKEISNIYPIKKGVWSKDTYLKIVNPNDQNWAFVTQEVESNFDYDVEAISLPTILKKFNFDQIDLLKIDIEGAEKQLFNKNIESWLCLTRFIVIEFHDCKSKITIEHKLKNNGFILFEVNGENYYYENSKLIV